MTILHPSDYRLGHIHVIEQHDPADGELDGYVGTFRGRRVTQIEATRSSAFDQAAVAVRDDNLN